MTLLTFNLIYILYAVINIRINISFIDAYFFFYFRIIQFKHILTVCLTKFKLPIVQGVKLCSGVNDFLTWCRYTQINIIVKINDHQSRDQCLFIHSLPLITHRKREITSLNLFLSSRYKFTTVLKHAIIWLIPILIDLLLEGGWTWHIFIYKLDTTYPSWAHELSSVFARVRLVQSSVSV